MSCECADLCKCDCAACACHENHLVDKTERDEKNRALASWIEPKPRDLFDYAPVADSVSPGRAWMCRKGTLVVIPCDFYRSEEASALLLEKMPYVMLSHGAMAWYCDADAKSKVRLYKTSKDRKTAIAEAALLLAERGGQ